MTPSQKILGKFRIRLQTFLLCLLTYALLTFVIILNWSHVKTHLNLKYETRLLLKDPNDPDTNLVVRLFNLTNPGFNGTPVLIDVNRLPTAEAVKFNMSFYKRDVASYVSSLIPLRRPLPDIRIQDCGKLYSNLSLPEVSVVIVFHNEHWSTLLRTVHSIIDNSPRDVIKEVLLVDDFSTEEVLREPLNDYIARSFTNVRRMYTTTRQGLIRARNIGFKETSAPIVVFLDSHCECFQGWLEPLVARIVEDETIVTTPIVNVIESDNFSVRLLRGRRGPWLPCLTFPELFFGWTEMYTRELSRRQHVTDPVRISVMIGCAFAISRRWFQKLGMFDPGLELWGGENTELSLKTWMCGGGLEVVPCSNVAHMFHAHVQTKRFDHFKSNTARVARVWVTGKNRLSQITDIDDIHHDDIKERLAIKRSLKCRSFDYYLQHVFPELYIKGDGMYTGTVRPAWNRNLCLTANTTQTKKKDVHQVVLLPCSQNDDNQYWDFTLIHEVRVNKLCLDTGYNFKLYLYTCHEDRGHQLFEVDERENTGHVRIMRSQRCVSASVENGMEVSIQPCGFKHDLWIWQRNREYWTHE